MGIAPAALSKIPPSMRRAVLCRGEWSLCAMDHSRLDPICIEDSGVPFHHLALPLGTRPRLGMHVDGHRQRAEFAPDAVIVVEAEAGATTWWDDPFESACFYFTPDALESAIGRDVGPGTHRIRTTPNLHMPIAVHLLRALYADAAAGQPHGSLIGDSIFVALAAQLTAGSPITTAPSRTDRRVRRALEYIHAHLTCEALSIPSIAAAAATSPFHLSRVFRTALGCPIWQYVLRERARHARILMRDASLSLVDVSMAAGFETYSSFASALRREFGCTPGALRARA